MRRQPPQTGGNDASHKQKRACNHLATGAFRRLRASVPALSWQHTNASAMPPVFKQALFAQQRRLLYIQKKASLHSKQGLFSKQEKKASIFLSYRLNPLQRTFQNFLQCARIAGGSRLDFRLMCIGSRRLPALLLRTAALVLTALLSAVVSLLLLPVFGALSTLVLRCALGSCGIGA